MKYILGSLLILILACNSPKSFTGETLFAGASEQGTLMMNTAGYGQSKILAIENAEINALKNLLFKGIPGSPYRKAMVENPSKTQAQFATYFNNLFQKGAYKAFLMESTVLSPFKMLANRRSNINVQLKYDVEALRKDLEAKGIIRKFGF